MEGSRRPRKTQTGCIPHLRPTLLESTQIAQPEGKSKKEKSNAMLFSVFTTPYDHMTATDQSQRVLPSSSC
jgi:hypothetical protein